VDLTPGPGGEFEAMLRDPNEQFDRRPELLKSIVEYAQAEPASASGNGTPKDGLVAVVLSAADVEQIRAEAYRVGREDGLRQANNAITWNTACLNCSALLDIGIREHEAGYRAGREAAARDIREKTATFCMDGVGRHLVDTCAWFAKGEVNQPRTPLADVSGDTESSPEVDR
jgi:hypothetical protein